MHFRPGTVTGYLCRLRNNSTVHGCRLPQQQTQDTRQTRDEYSEDHTGSQSSRTTPAMRHRCVVELQVWNETSAALDVWMGPQVSPAAATPVWQDALAYGARLPMTRGLLFLSMNLLWSRSAHLPYRYSCACASSRQAPYCNRKLQCMRGNRLIDCSIPCAQIVNAVFGYCCLQCKLLLRYSRCCDLVIQ